MSTIATGITKSRAGHYTAWGKASGHIYADATIPLCNISEARAHVAAMRAACDGIDDTKAQAAALYTYQQAHR